MRHRITTALVLALCALPVTAQEAEQDSEPAQAETLIVDPQDPEIPPTPATFEEGAEAWQRIHEIVSHPRCTNCHVGAEAGGVPMWNGLGYGTSAPHGMGIKADETRIGALSTPCRTCHITAQKPNEVPHAPPAIDDDWRLPPVELAWLDRTEAEICAQLRNPETNDLHDLDSLIEHIETSAFVAWGFAPGGGRSAPDGSPESMARDVRAWGEAGFPCPS